MAVSLDLASLQSVAKTLHGSFLIQALMLLLLVLLLRYVAASWCAGLAPYEVQTCPPINPHVHYRYGVSQMQGRRPYMEDRHTAIADLNGDPNQSFYGIFDGHGGEGAANYCMQAMCQNVIREPLLNKEPVEALKNGFLRTDQEYLQIANRKNSEDGTTAVVLLTQGDEMFVAHAGDSRAVLVHRCGKVSVLTSDHKPNRPDERRRIQELGGSVVFWGVWRVEGILAVSRAIGDRMLKPFVVAEPEVKKFTRTEADRYVVLASDGVWDTVSNDDVAQLVLRYEDPQAAAQRIMEEAYARGSMDNICAMVIDLRALFVCTQTYDIPCDPRQPAKWLLMQAKTIQRSSQKHTPPEDELEVLYNRTTRQVLNLEESIGRSVSTMDVIDARTLLQTPDTSSNSAMFPWLQSYPGGLQLSSNKSDSSNGLFFQQLYAFTLIGKRTPVSAAQLKQKKDQDAFLSLVHTYVMGNYDQDNRSRPQTTNTAGNGRHSCGNGGCSAASSDMYSTTSREHHYIGARPSPISSSPAYLPEHDPNGFSDSGSDSSVEDSSSHPTRSLQTSEFGGPQRIPAPSSPAQVPIVSSPSISHLQNALDGIENVFDIVFKQQAIGMKLGADETKQYAIVKECFEGSEAKRYPEIQSGVVIMAVNGQEVSGLGLSRVLYRLREAPRPVVVRFGRMSTRQLKERRKARGPW